MTAADRSDVYRRLATAFAAYRASVEARGKARQAAAGSALLRRYSARVAAVKPEHLEIVELMLAELEEPLQLAEWTTDDQWAVVREVKALRDEGVPSIVIARCLIQLGACRGTGRVAEVQACMAVMRRQRDRYNDRQTP